MADYLLSLEDERTVLAAETPGAAPWVLPAVGWRTIARDHLEHDPPSALALENAIAAIEDDIARAGSRPAPGSRLRTHDARVREIALAAGLPARTDAVFALSAVEQAFQRLAARAARGLRSPDGFPAGNEAAAALLILRELMHHLGFAAIVVQPPPTGNDP